MKLGELLVRKGIIDWPQLEEALSDQLVHGGHLGTCLIERKFIDEATLGQALAETAGMPYAPPRVFQDIPRNVIGTIPYKLVVKHSVIPFRLSKQTLDVAMINPKDLTAIDELSFAAGCGITPWISPEATILQALERYYDIPRRRRYVTLSEHVDRHAPTSQVQLSQIIVRPGGEWNDGAMSDAVGSVDAPRRPAASRAASGSGGEATIEAVATRMCRCESFEELADVLLGYASHGVARMVLFRVQHGQARIGKASGIETDALADPALRFPVSHEPVFTLLRGKDHYRGSLPDGPEFLAFYDKLEIEKPAEVLVLPSYLNDQLIGMFYADGGPTGTIVGETNDYRRLMKKLAFALHAILLRKQILVA